MDFSTRYSLKKLYFYCICHFLTCWKKPGSFPHVVVTFDMMEKSNLKGTNLGSMKRALIVLKFHVLVIGNRLTYAMNMDWKRILPFKLYGDFKTCKLIVIFLLTIVLLIFTHVKHDSNIKIVIHLCKITYIQQKHACLP